MPTYYLIDDGRSMPRWSELAVGSDGQDSWVDFKGRRVPYAEGKPLAHVEGANIHVTLTGVSEAVADLERSFAFTHLLDPWSDQGWLSPDGKFWGCAFFAHDDIAYALIRRTPAELEGRGWVRVHADSYRTGDGVRRVTRRQEEVLFSLGFEDFEGWRRRKPYEADRTSPPPRFAVRQPKGFETKATAAPVQAEPPSSEDAALERILGLFLQNEAFSALAEDECERIADVGPGTWSWMLRWDGMDIGGEDRPAELAAAQGLHLRATSFDTVEVSAWPFGGIRIDPEAMRMIEGRGRGPFP